MKFNGSRYILFFLLICVTAGVSAQQKHTSNELQQIADNEKAAYSKLMQPHESLIVNNYDLKYHRFFLFADPSKSSISGSVTSYFVSTQTGMESIQFELYKTISADSAFYHGVKKSPAHNGNVVTVPFDKSVAQGSLDSVTIFYHGDPTASGFGSFGREIHAGAWALWTLSEPYGASDWWPSKNDLTDKIDSIDMFVVTPKGNHVASNGMLISETPYGPNAVLAHWKHRYPIASYLIAIASTNYARFSDYYVTADSSLEVLNYVYPEDSSLLVNNAKDAIPAMQFFEEIFAPYPFRAEKYGQAQFGWSGGMEHQTMTFLGKGAFSRETITHELAHQWFGDMITCGSWHDIWLNEGFATYLTGLRYERTDKEYWDLWKRSNISYVCGSGGGSVYCDDTTSVNRIFDSRLSYRKGALILHQLRWIIGDSAFFKGMNTYLEDPKLKHGFARSSDFQKHLEAASGKNLDGYFADWLYGQGYPTYTIHVGQSADHSATVTINQGQSHPSVSFFEMPVPIMFAGEGKDTIIVFNNTSSGQVFSFNPGFGISTVTFDPEHWLISSNNSVTLGIEDLPAGKFLTLSPNPATDQLAINHNLGPFKFVEITAVDGKSTKTFPEETSETSMTIHVNSLKDGVYILRLGFQQGIVTRKFVVKK